MKIIAQRLMGFVLGFVITMGLFQNSYAQPIPLLPKVDSSIIHLKNAPPVIGNNSPNQIIDSVKIDSVIKSEARKEGQNSGELETPLSSIQEVISYEKIFWSLAVLFLTYFFILILIKILENISERSAGYRLFIKRLIPILRIMIWIIAIYFIIQGIIQPPFQTIVAVSASIGIAVGFASQDILKNIFGGIMIILDRPFQVGDKIDIGGHYGEVIQIGLRSVRIVTPDDSVVSIPNGELMNQSVSNTNSGALDCQVVAEIYLPHDVDILEAKELAWMAAATSKYVYLNKPIAIIVKNEVINRSNMIKLRIKAYVIDIRFEFPFMSDMTERFMASFYKKLPHTTLMKHDETTT